MDYFDRADFYNRYRRADSRLVDTLIELLALPKHSVIADIGAGTGNYSASLAARGFTVYSVEPEAAMRKNGEKNLNWVPSFAEDIHIADGAIDGAIAINAIHHFNDVEKSLKEIYRILNKGPLCIFTFDNTVAQKLWIFDYWQQLNRYEESNYLPIETLKELIGNVFAKEVQMLTYELPFDFTDVFSAAVWARPHLLFENNIRQSMSLFSSLDASEFGDGLLRLRNDLNSGRFDRLYPYCKTQKSYDVGCRILLVNKG